VKAQAQGWVDGLIAVQPQAAVSAPPPAGKELQSLQTIAEKTPSSNSDECLLSKEEIMSRPKNISASPATRECPLASN
jgi:hypothetical protein